METFNSTLLAEAKKPGATKAAPPAPTAAISSVRPQRGRIRRVAALLTVCAALAAGIYAWRTWSAPDRAADRFVTDVVQRGDLEDVVTATGTLQPRDYVDVGTQVSGQLKKIHVEIGSVVRAGDLLAEIDPTVYRARVDADGAQLRNLRAQLTDRQSQRVLAEQQLTRQQNLMKAEATTAEALQTAEAGVRSAIAQVEALQAQIEQTESTLRGDEANLGYTKIHAPMAGTVVSQTAKQGQTLNANQQAPIVLRLADLSTMTVQTQVSEADVSKLRIGMDVYFTTLGSERRWYGKLRQVNPTPTVVNNVVLYDALFDVPNEAQVLMTQMTAQVFFVVAQVKDALQIPISALRPIGGERRRSQPPAGRASDVVGAARAQFANGRGVVSVVTEENVIEERTVQLGVMNRVAAQVLSGLDPGETVIAGTRTPAAQPPSGAGARRMLPRV